MTAQAICEHFASVGQPMALATVYRQLGKLVDAGVIRRFSPGPSAPACYEYVGGGQHCHREACLHLKCRVCGKLIHLHCDEVTTVQAHMAVEHGFAWDISDTVFLGTCSECASDAGQVRP